MPTLKKGNGNPSPRSYAPRGVLANRLHGNIGTTAVAAKAHATLAGGKDRVVLTHANILARMKLRPPLAN